LNLGRIVRISHKVCPSSHVTFFVECLLESLVGQTHQTIVNITMKVGVQLRE